MGVAMASPLTWGIAGTDQAYVRAPSGRTSTADCGFTTNAPSYWGASAASADEVWFSGQNYHLCRWRADAGFQGVSLQAPSTIGPALYAIKAFPSGVVVTTGYGGLVATREADGGVSQVHNGVQNFNALDGPSPDDLVAVGDYGAIWRYRAGTWKDESLSIVGEYLNGVAVRGPDDAWAVGGTRTAHTPWVLHWSGANWDDALPPGVGPSDVLFSVAADDAGTLVMAGRRYDDAGVATGLLLRYRVR